MEYKQFFKDRTFLIPLGIIFIAELLMQVGCYKPFLKKNSYAANVNRIVDHVISKQDELDPDVLVFGTSVGYQGLSVRLLNESLASTGHKLNSISIPGSELIVQELAMEKTLAKFKKVKTVIHVMELTMPWVNHDDLALPTLAMISEFNRIDAMRKAYEHEYEIKYDDLAYIGIRSLAYRRDMRDFFFSPDKRIKDISKNIRFPNTEVYDYENAYHQKISSYRIKNLEDCRKKTGPDNTDLIPDGSDSDHKHALFDTCSLAMVTNIAETSTPKSEKYFRRLRKLYQVLQNRNIRVINVFAPYSSLIGDLGGQKRVAFWEKELVKILGSSNVTVIDEQFLFKEKNSDDYFYDLIHLNRNGMISFSLSLGEKLKEKL